MFNVHVDKNSQYTWFTHYKLLDDNSILKQYVIVDTKKQKLIQIENDLVQTIQVVRALNVYSKNKYGQIEYPWVKSKKRGN